jgi:hypothetical protein
MGNDYKGGACGIGDRKVPRAPILVGPLLGKVGSERSSEELEKLARMADVFGKQFTDGLSKVEK